MKAEHLGTFAYLSIYVSVFILLQELYLENNLLLAISLYILASLLIGFISQVIIRLYPDKLEKESFLRNAEKELTLFRKNINPRLEDLEFTLIKIKENPISLVGIGIITVFGIIALLAPVLAPPSGSENPYILPHDGFSQIPKPPSDEHPLGTTRNQYDIYYGCIWGTRTAFRVGILVVGGVLLVGVALGSLAGYFGGILDLIIMRGVDIVIAVPAIVLAIMVVTVFGKDLDIVMAALIFAYWPYYTRLIRSEILSVREEEYVEAAKAVGGSDFRIITKHIIPNSSQSVLVMATLDMATMVLVAASLSFLGLGAPRNFADWGGLLSFSREFVTEPGMWFTHVFPGLFIFLYMFGWILISDAFRDIRDPWLRRR